MRIFSSSCVPIMWGSIRLFTRRNRPYSVTCEAPPVTAVDVERSSAHSQSVTSCIGSQPLQSPFCSFPLRPATQPLQVIQPVIIFASQPCVSPPVTPLPFPQVDPVPQPDYPPSPIVRCTCSKTHCLKLYCECLKAGRTCTELCGCTDCLNRAKFPERKKALKRMKKRNPKAFKRVCKVNGYTDTWCCACQKSLCNKKYCSCYQSGRYCTDNCKCVDCNNRPSDVFV